MNNKLVTFVDAWSQWALSHYVCTDEHARANLRALREHLHLPEVDGSESWEVGRLYEAMVDARDALAVDHAACKWCNDPPAPGDNVCETCRSNMAVHSRLCDPLTRR